MAQSSEGGLATKISGLFGGGKKSAPKPKPKPKLSTEELAKDLVDPNAGKIWPAKRLNVVEKLWGEGFTTPGGADQVIKMLPLLELDSKKSALVLGAGLGGINETIIDKTGTWITCLERDPELAQIAMATMKRAGLKKQAPVHVSTMEEMKLKPKSFDRVLSFEGTLNVADKKALFTSVCESLRVNGELMFTTFVLPDTNPPNEQVKAWLAAEPEQAVPQLWPLEAQVGLLRSLNMEVRPVSEMSFEYKKWVMNGFMRFMSTITKAEMKSMAGDLLKEVEYWTRRVTAIESGGVRVCRFHAIKLPEKKKR